MREDVAKNIGDRATRIDSSFNIAHQMETVELFLQSVAELKPLLANIPDEDLSQWDNPDEGLRLEWRSNQIKQAIEGADQNQSRAIVVITDTDDLVFAAICDERESWKHMQFDGAFRLKLHDLFSIGDE